MTLKYGMNMWASLSVGEFTKSLEMDNDIMTVIASSLSSHPLVDDSIAKSIAAQTLIVTEESVPQPVYADFCPTGEGWFEDKLGKSATQIVKELRKARRVFKDSREEIDSIIDNVRKIKSMEVDATLKSLNWSQGYEGTVRDLGVSEKDLRSLRLFGNTRKSSLVRACNTWDAANDALHKLDEFEDVWGEEEKNAWVNAMQMKQDARKMWRNSLHQFDNLSKEQQKWLKMSKEQVELHGSMSARAITENLIQKGVSRLNPNRLSKLLKMYGEEINIIKSPRKGEYMSLSKDGLIIKDPWAYAAGFLDADGYITITERGEPRAGFIATGDRGRIHCEQLHKNIGAGRLQLDQKVYKNGQKSQHRVSFYSKDDLTKLLAKITPHLRLKDRQAKAVSAYLKESDPIRKVQLKRFVQFSNRDGTTKGEESLREWGVDKDTVMSWAV
tara:strand:- start:1518 stop:2843 length:1326 start_codon:yes stop_codon:yes gene_type:complete